jgi:hypothetical protein
MRLRSIVHVVGPSDVGKTTFIEALLHAEAAFATCVRGEHSPNLRGSRESASRRQPEVRRYLEAGAAAAAHYRFGEPDEDSFFVSDVMQDYSEAVLIEGDCPLEHHDLSVFVAPPLATGRDLLRRVKRDHRAEHEAQLAALERAGSSPEACIEWMSLQMGPSLGASLARFPTVLEDMCGQMQALRPEARKTRPPAATVHWTLAEGYEGLEHAQLIVVNLRNPNQRDGAEAVIAGVTRLRKDPAVFDEVLGYRGSRTPVTAVVANLADTRDAGLKKAIARVKRSTAAARERR